MSRAAQNLLDKARKNKRGWKPDDLLTLYSGYNFKMREGKGSHKIFTHPKLPGRMAVVPFHTDELHPKYVTQALRYIEEVISMEESNE